MKITTRSPHLLHLGQLLGLALIGFVLWLAAIGWILVTPANAAPGEQRHGNPEKRLARMQPQLNLPPNKSTDFVRSWRTRPPSTSVGEKNTVARTAG